MSFDLCYVHDVENTWPRLQSSLEKPHWISVDFDHFEYQDDSEPEDEDEKGQAESMDPEKLERIVRDFVVQYNYVIESSTLLILMCPYRKLRRRWCIKH